MLKLDNLTIIAPSLEDGSAHVRAQLGIDMPMGGSHRQMGTHNLLLRLGEGIFLKVISVDPSAARPHHPRWFGLDDSGAVRSAWDEGRRLRGWVARTDNMDAILTKHGHILGRKEHLSRGSRNWLFSVPPDGSLPAGGIAPSIINWGKQGNPVPTMQDVGAHLRSFQIEHPDPEYVTGLYRTLGISDPPSIVKGPQLRYSAVIETPNGSRVLSQLPPSCRIRRRRAVYEPTSHLSARSSVS